jgi:hypothetical protein
MSLPVQSPGGATFGQTSQQQILQELHGNTGPQSQNTMEKENYDENKSAYSRNSITSTQFEK